MFITKIFKDYSNFSRSSNRFEYGIYQIFSLIVTLVVTDFSSKINFKTNNVSHMFYIWIIILITFVPFQSVTVRRLNDLKLNRTLVILNFIPIINIFLKIYLLIMIGKIGRNRKENKIYRNSVSDINQIGNS